MSDSRILNLYNRSKKSSSEIFVIDFEIFVPIRIEFLKKHHYEEQL